MRRGFSLSALLAAALAAAGCTYGSLEYFVPAPKAETNFEVATRTVAQLKTLAAGQSREEVLARLRLDPVEGCVEWSWESREFYLRHNGWLRCTKTAVIASPYRSETFPRGGTSYEVLYYYTGGTDPEGGITDQQLTPVLLGNGTLVGWGWDHPLVKQLGSGLSAVQASAADTTAVAKAAPSEAAQPTAAPKSAMKEFEEVYFALNQWQLSTEDMKTLAEHAAYLKENPTFAITIEGYADEQGSAEYNRSLGEKRAEEVRRFLAGLGVSNTLTVISYGKDRLVCTEQNDACYAKNRRVHLTAEN